MAELTIAMTYGNALFQAAEERDKTEQILAEAGQVAEIFQQEPEFFTFLTFPAISAKEKKEVLKTVFQDKICQELLNLLYVLIDKSRIYHYSRIVKVYQDLVRHEEGCAYGTIYSVEPLKAAQLDRFEQETTQLLGQKVKLENELDPRLMGGVKILVEGRILDLSIRKRFEDLSSRII